MGISPFCLAFSVSILIKPPWKPRPGYNIAGAGLPGDSLKMLSGQQERWPQMAGAQHDTTSAVFQVRQRLRRSAEAAGRSQDKIRIVAVSKYHPVEKIREAFGAGMTDFGENYAQELVAKATALRDLKLAWSFTGQLQSNKIRKIVQYADEIQALACLKHGRLIEKYAVEMGKRPFPVWICVNSGHEQSKGGVSFAEAEVLGDSVARELPGLELQGIMAIPPAGLISMHSEQAAEARGIPPLYRKLRVLADSTGRGLLSLGMSKDLELAVRAGSDVLRVGTDLFGKRPG